MDIVVLLHGLGRTPFSMLALALAARRRGYRVINWLYRSRTRTIAENADAFGREVAPRLSAATRVHFVTHSLGGIVLRRFLAAHSLPNLGRVVMIAPPNGGSEVADVLQNTPLNEHIAPLSEVGTGEGSVPRSLPPAHFPLAVIAGSRSHMPLFSRWMKHAPNDGVVTVETTKLAGMSAFLVLHRTHTFLPWSPDAIGQTFRFIEEGSFNLLSQRKSF